MISAMFMPTITSCRAECYNPGHMTVYFATSNKHKVDFARKAFKPFGFKVEQIQVELAESRSEDPEAIVLEKAEQAFRLLKKPVLVDDGGFFIRALNGFPKTQVKYSLNTLGIVNIMKMLEGVKDRHAEWRMSVAYVYGPDKHKVFTFVEKGRIAEEIRPVKRTCMSDYWRIYVPTMLKGNKKALSEMTDADMEAWTDYFNSHNHWQRLGVWLSKHS